MQKSPLHPHHVTPVPHAERMHEIKAGYRKQAEAQREQVRLAEEARAKEEAEAAARAEEETRQAAAEEEARMQRRPWRMAGFKKGVVSPTENTEPEPLEHMPVEEVAAEEDARPDREKSLEAIFLEGEGRVPDLGRLERRRSWRVLWGFGIATTCVAVLVGVAWSGYFLFQPYREFRGKGLELTIESSPLVALGREETFEVKFANRHVQSLEHSEIRLVMPRGFTAVAFDPLPTKPETQTWLLNQFAPGQSGSIRVRGYFVGALGESQPIQAIGVYRPLGYGKDVETLGTAMVRVSQTVLTGQFIVPPKVVAGDPVALRYAVTNRGDQAMKSLLARIEYPRGFTPVSASGTAGVVELALGSIPPNSTSTVQVVGTFSAGVSGDMDLHAEAGWRREDGQFLAAQQSDARLVVLAGDLQLRLVANGADTDKTIQPGEPLRVAVAYQNVSPEPLKDVSITLGFETVMNGLSATGTSLLDWSRLSDERSGVSTTKTRIQTITYTKQELPQLESLPPGSEGVIEVGIPSRQVASGTREALVRILVTGNVPTVGETRVNRVVRVTPLNLRYRSDASLTAEARYYTEEGAPIGVGPLPPVQGKQTTYRVTWTVQKTLHPLENVKITAMLPKIVAWTGKTIGTGGTLLFDETTRVMSWTLSALPEGMSEAEVAFDVQLTPGEADVGRFASLLGETKLEAIDPAVKEPVVRLRAPLSTDLQNDDGAKGKGVVKAK